MKQDDIDCKYTKEITCPHCGYEQGDSWEASDNGEEICDECEKEYTYERVIDVTYNSYKNIIPNESQVIKDGANES